MAGERPSHHVDTFASCGGTDEPVAGADVEDAADVGAVATVVVVTEVAVREVAVTGVVVRVVVVVVLVAAAVGSTPSALPGSGPVAAKLTALALSLIHI